MKPICLKNNAFDEVNKYINGRNVVIITDSNVEKLYASKFLCPAISFPAGEKNKTREQVSKIQDKLLELGYSRDTLIVALGGGVVSDLAGFVASTYMRGVPYVIYSTTLLSAFDACVGGKTAVDTTEATNMIGSFYLPEQVYIDIGTWATLPEREIKTGLAESIKHALIASPKLLNFIKKNYEKILKLDYETCFSLTKANIKIKTKYVKKDFYDTKGLRKALNFGHTFGRAIETLSNYKLNHGEAVSIGMCLALKLSEFNELERIETLLKCIGLPTTIPDYIDKKELIKKLYTDKKVRNGKINFVLLKKIGKTYTKAYDETKLLNFLLCESE